MIKFIYIKRMIGILSFVILIYFKYECKKSTKLLSFDGTQLYKKFTLKL